jgi:hypothetical protein
MVALSTITRMNLQKAVIPVIPVISVTAVIFDDYVRRGRASGHHAS